MQMFTLLIMLAGAATTGEGSRPFGFERDRVSLFGVEICLGDVKARCDFRVPKLEPKPAPSPPASEPMQFSLFGKTICIGTPRPGVPCDLRVGPEQGSESANAGI